MDRRRIFLVFILLLGLLLWWFLRAPESTAENSSATLPNSKGPVVVSGPASATPVEAVPAEAQPPGPPPVVIRSADAEGVEQTLDANPEFIESCFMQLREAGITATTVSLKGIISSAAQHTPGPRGFVSPLKVYLPDGTEIPPGNLHCFEAMVNTAPYETPKLGPVPFTVDLDAPESAPAP